MTSISSRFKRKPAGSVETSANALVNAGFFVDPVQATPDFFRAIVSDGKTRVQVDVAQCAASRRPGSKRALGVFAHDLRDIAANKISAYENRVEVKDAIDLFYLARTSMGRDVCRRGFEACADRLRESTAFSGSAAHRRGAFDPRNHGRRIRRVRYNAPGANRRRDQKKVQAATLRIAELSSSLLWDTPSEHRAINDQARPVLARRASNLPLPQRIALLEAMRSEKKSGPTR